MNIINCYIDFNGFQFGDTIVNFVKQYGEAAEHRENRLGEVEITHDDVTYRFLNGTFEECTFTTSGIDIIVNTLFVNGIWEWLKDNDPECVSHLGFRISIKYGMAVDDDPKYNYLTVFRKGRWDKYYYKGMRLTNR